MSEKTANHMGTKFFGFFFGLILAVIYTVKAFFSPTFDAVASIPYILYVWAIFLLVVPAIVFLAEIFWRFVHKYSEKLPA